MNVRNLRRLLALGAALTPLVIAAPALAQEADGATATAAAQDSRPPVDPATLTADQRIALLEQQLGALQAQPFNLGYDDYLGRLAICRIYQGSIRTGSAVWMTLSLVVPLNSASVGAPISSCGGGVKLRA